MTTTAPLKPETLAIHAGRRTDATTGAVTAPIHMSTTFERDSDGEYRRGFNYGRDDNPNRSSLEARLAALEGGDEGIAFSSGTAATLAVFHAARGHILVGDDAYHGTVRQLENVVSGWGRAVSFADTTSLPALQAAVRSDTGLIWLESPGNPLLRVSDIGAIATLCRERAILFACDNTFATPILQNPLALGADVVVHSTTKYIGGHSDVTGGAVIGSAGSPVMAAVRQFQKAGGGIPSPFDCWLLARSIATLPLRVRAQCDTAFALARYLDEHPAVEQVFYPGLTHHPNHQVAARQMRAFGAMISFCVQGGKTAAMEVAAKVRLCTRATSLGGVESLIEHRASIEGPGSRAPDNLLRMSVGLEHRDDLIADLAQALQMPGRAGGF